MGNHLKELLDEFYYHEAMDRTAMITDIVDRYLVTHPVFKAEKEFAEKVEQAGMLLAEAYQIIGSISVERIENKEKNG
jgi:hypothetical protein